MKEFILKIFNQTKEYLFPVSGGVVFGVQPIEATSYHFGIVQTSLGNPVKYFEVVIFAAIGATVGYMVKLGLDAIFKSKKKLVA